MACHAAELWVTVRGGQGGEETGEEGAGLEGPESSRRAVPSEGAPEA